MQEALSPQLVGLCWLEGLRAAEQQQMPHSSAHHLQQRHYIVERKGKFSGINLAHQLTLLAVYATI